MSTFRAPLRDMQMTNGAKLATARFYADLVLNQALLLHHEIVHGSVSVVSLTEEQFDLDRRILVVA